MELMGKTMSSEVEDYTSEDRLLAFLEAASEVRETTRAITVWRNLALDDVVILITATKFGWRYTATGSDCRSFCGQANSFHQAVSLAAQRVSGD